MVSIYKIKSGKRATLQFDSTTNDEKDFLSGLNQLGFDPRSSGYEYLNFLSAVLVDCRYR